MGAKKQRTDGVSRWKNYKMEGGSLLNDTGGENFEKLQFDPPPTIRYKRVPALNQDITCLHI